MTTTAESTAFCIRLNAFNSHFHIKSSDQTLSLNLDGANFHHFENLMTRRLFVLFKIFNMCHTPTTILLDRKRENFDINRLTRDIMECDCGMK